MRSKTESGRYTNKQRKNLSKNKAKPIKVSSVTWGPNTESDVTNAFKTLKGDKYKKPDVSGEIQKIMKEIKKKPSK